jgi:pyridoxamine 5'-phosphate oxidase
MDPLKKLAEWIEEARQRGCKDPEAMALSTTTPAGIPSVRIVLCRGVDARGLRFFTNYESRKGSELDANPHAAVAFYWPALDRQVRVEGPTERLPPAESDEYFAHRPRGHQISAWASAQSRPLPNLDGLRDRASELADQYRGRDVPRPPYWGGYLLRPTAVEFWTQGNDRLHDRVRYESKAGLWAPARLAP